MTPGEIHRQEQLAARDAELDAEIAAHLSAGGQLVPSGDGDWAVLEQFLVAGELVVCPHRTALARYLWTPRHPTHLRCRICFATATPNGDDLCDSCGWRPAVGWREMDAPRYTPQGEPVYGCTVTIHLRLCSNCNSQREHT